MGVSNLVVAIDGPSASGKSTVAKRVAQALDCVYVDSGAFYRAVAWQAGRRGIAADNTGAIAQMLADMEFHVTVHQHSVVISVDGNVPGEELRSRSVRETVSPLAVLTAVRTFVTDRLRATRSFGDLVMEGRDIGSVVFPDAQFKFYLDADPEERARRRQRDLVARNESVDAARVARALRERDARDSSRSAAPLRVAAGAERVDSTALSIDEVVSHIVARVRAVAK